MDLQVLVDGELPPIVPNAVSYECGSTPEHTKLGLVYEHHGEGFSVEHQGALTQFFEDVSLGHTLPTTFATHSIRDVDTVFAVTLFLNRDLALVPAMVGIVAQIDLVHRRGVAMLGHLDPAMVAFIRLLRGYFPEGLPKAALGNRIHTAAGWVRDVVTEGTFPAGNSLPQITILDRGTGGFVVAESVGDLMDAWVVAYSMGFVRGVLVGPDRGGRRRVVASRKSRHIVFDLDLAARLLNEVESAMGALPKWERLGDWLFSPEDGTVLTVPNLMEIFLRV